MGKVEMSGLVSTFTSAERLSVVEKFKGPD